MCSRKEKLAGRLSAHKVYNCDKTYRVLQINGLHRCIHILATNRLTVRLLSQWCLTGRLYVMRQHT